MPILLEVEDELERAIAKFPDQHLADGTGGGFATAAAARAKLLTDYHAADGTVTWLDVLKEEVQEAFAETEWWRLRAELIQVAAMAVRWIEDGDSRPDVPTQTKGEQ
jgi:hypothetical protein